MSFFPSVKTVFILCVLWIILVLMVSPVSAVDYVTSGLSYQGHKWYNGDPIGPYGNNYASACSALVAGSSPASTWGISYFASPPVNVGSNSGEAISYGSSGTIRYGYTSSGQYLYAAPTVQCNAYPHFGLIGLSGEVYYYNSGSRPAPDISITADPSSSIPVFISTITLNGVTVFDTVSHFNITSPNNTVYSLSSPASFSIDHEGSWFVQATATNSGGSDYATTYVTGTTDSPPVASAGANPINGSSPLEVQFTDTSSHVPTSWLWTIRAPSTMSIYPGGVSGGEYTIASNITQNPKLLFTGSGDVDVTLQVSNSIGSDDVFYDNMVTVVGVAPTPTPTPNIPWPNQTGVCQHSGISLGSGQIREFNVHYQLTDPQGDTYSGQYITGVVNVVSGQPFFTALEGQYIYNEYSMVDSTLLWRQSYIVEDCTVTPTPTTAIPTQTPFPTFTYTGVPTVPVPMSTIDWTGKTSNTSLNFDVDLPTNISLPELPATLPTIPPIINEINIINETCDNSTYLASIFCPITVQVRVTETTFNDILIDYLFVPIVSPFVMVINMGVSTMSDFQGILNLWNITVSIFRGLIWNSFMAIPPKALNAMSVPLIGEILKEIIDWPTELSK